jgi:cystathionine beta-lyase/cystathionine gamma-synthase
MLSFEPVGDVTDARRFVEAVDIITLAESHGGIETLRGRNQPVQVISSRHQ